MPYRPSEPLRRWSSERSDTIDVLGRLGIDGPPASHAYVVVMMREFQGFVRELHDLAATRIIADAGADDRYRHRLLAGLTHERLIDRGNATIRSIRSDFARLRIDSITLSAESGDIDLFHTLMRFRNAVSHGDAQQLERVIVQGLVRDDLAWARSRMRILDRLARGLDQSVWDHFHQTTGDEPW